MKEQGDRNGKPKIAEEQTEGRGGVESQKKNQSSNERKENEIDEKEINK